MAHTLSTLIRRANRSVTVEFKQRTKELTLVQINILMLLADGKQMQQATLGEEASIDRSTMTEVLSRMQKSGLLVTVGSPKDRRLVLVQITPEGRRAWHKNRKHLEAAEQAVLARVSPAYRTIFSQSLQALGT